MFFSLLRGCVCYGMLTMSMESVVLKIPQPIFFSLFTVCVHGGESSVHEIGAQGGPIRGSDFLELVL